MNSSDSPAFVTLQNMRHLCSLYELYCICYCYLSYFYRGTDSNAEGIRKSKINKSSMIAGDKDTANDIGDIFDSLETSSSTS